MGGLATVCHDYQKVSSRNQPGLFDTLRNRAVRCFIRSMESGFARRSLSGLVQIDPQIGRQYVQHFPEFASSAMRLCAYALRRTLCTLSSIAYLVATGNMLSGERAVFTVFFPCLSRLTDHNASIFNIVEGGIGTCFYPCREKRTTAQGERRPGQVLQLAGATGLPPACQTIGQTIG